MAELDRVATGLTLGNRYERTLFNSVRSISQRIRIFSARPEFGDANIMIGRVWAQEIKEVWDVWKKPIVFDNI